MERLSPSFHCPWLSIVAVLVVVGSISPGDFFLGLMGGSPCGSVFFSTRKSDLWGHAHGSGECPPMPKTALLLAGGGGGRMMAAVSCYVILLVLLVLLVLLWVDGQ